MKRVLIAGGGTGGHLFPGIAVAEELRRRFGCEVRFIGSEFGIERTAVPRAGYEVELLPVRGLRRSGVRAWVATVWSVPQSVWRALRALRRFRPELVIAVGGYASFPAGAAAALLRVPLVLLEQNAVPGLTTRLLAPLARRICVSLEVSRRSLRRGSVVVTGNPIRQLALPPGTVAGEGAPSGGFRVLVFGGSAGAHRLNLIVPEAIALVRDGVSVVHQAGAADRDAVAAHYERLGVAAGVHDFIQDMGRAYAGADLVICRAGATTIAELTALGIAAILIPYPYAAGDHQRLNAQALVDGEAGWMVLDAELDAARLAALVDSIRAQPSELARRRERARMLGRPDAAARVVDECVAAL